MGGGGRNFIFTDRGMLNICNQNGGGGGHINLRPINQTAELGTSQQDLGCAKSASPSAGAQNIVRCAPESLSAYLGALSVLS